MPRVKKTPDLETQVAEQESVLVNLRANIEHLLGIEALADPVKAIQAATIAAEKEFDSANSKLAVANESVARIQAEYRTLSAKLVEIENGIALAVQERAKKQEEFNALKKEFDEFSSKASEARSTLAHLEGKIQNAKSELSLVAEEISSKKAQIAEYQKESSNSKVLIEENRRIIESERREFEKNAESRSLALDKREKELAEREGEVSFAKDVLKDKTAYLLRVKMEVEKLRGKRIPLEL